MPPYIPKYVSPEQKAKDRARLKARLYWSALAIPVALALLVFGYSDQAPAALRIATIALDQAFGYPLARMLGVVAAP